MPRRDVISIGVGQAGLNMGHCFWELLGEEHAIGRDGQPRQRVPPAHRDVGTTTFYRMREPGHRAYSPRLTPHMLFFDVDSSPADEIRTGPHRELFEPWQFVAPVQPRSSPESLSIASETVERCTESMRREAELSDSLRGFLFMGGMDGCTGAALTRRLLEETTTDFGRKFKFGSHVLSTSDLMVDAPGRLASYDFHLNTVFGMGALIEHMDQELVIDNAALLEICYNVLRLEYPSFVDLNHLIAQTLSGLTASHRSAWGSHGPMSFDPLSSDTLLIPFPKAHFYFAGLGGLVRARCPSLLEICQAHLRHQPITGQDLARLPTEVREMIGYSPASRRAQPFLQDCWQEEAHLSLDEITRGALHPDHLLLRCNPGDANHRFTSVALQYRGDVQQASAHAAVERFEARNPFRFVDWAANHVSVGVAALPPASVHGSPLARMPRSAIAYCGGSFLGDFFDGVVKAFDRNRSFRPSYIDGIKGDEVEESREDLVALVNDYTFF